MVAARKEGSMDGPLFRQFILTQTKRMYPEGTVSLEITRCARTGRLISGPVMWTVDFGPGRVEANAVLTPDWDKWAIEMRDHGILIMILLPNSTALTALMDKLFGPFKAACRENLRTHRFSTPRESKSTARR
eukprot:scaffold5341_cov72-Cyclotella_meneghiniana.AAC.10